MLKSHNHPLFLTENPRIKKGIEDLTGMYCNSGLKNVPIEINVMQIAVKEHSECHQM